jgi:hypothetical protein
MSFGEIKKNNINYVKKKLNEFCRFWRIYGYVYDNMKSAQEEQQLPGDRPGCRLGGAHTRDPSKTMRSLGQEMIIYGTAVGGLELLLICCKERSLHVGDKQEDAGQAQGEPFGGVGEGGLVSHLT